MAEASARSSHSQHAKVTVGDVMQPPVTTVDENDHAAAAAYLMKHAHATALVVLDSQSGRPKGIITETDISHAVADRKNMEEVRIRELMTTHPTVIDATTGIRDAAKIMMDRHFRHLPVVGDSGIIGMVDIGDVCRALLAEEPG